MLADVIKVSVHQPGVAGGNPDAQIMVQDPVSGAIFYIDPTDDPNTTVVEDGRLIGIRCLVRGVIDGGIRVAGTTERFSDTYENVDWARMTFPAGVNINKRDRITNIRDLSQNILWREEEVPGGMATTFNVMGVTPIINPFGKHTENVALLQRAEVQ